MFATAGNSIKLWDAQNYTQYQEVPSVNGRISDISWSQNGQCIAFLGESVPDISLLAVNAKSTANIGVVRGVDSPSCIQFPCRSSHYLGIGNKDGSVVLWNLKSKSRKKAFSASDSLISHIAFSHNDSHIAAASKGNVRLLSLMNNSVNGPYKIFDNQIATEVVYCRVKKSLLGCCSEGGSVSLFDTHTCKILHTFHNAHAAPVSSMAFSPINEILLISVGYDKKLACYNIQTKKQVLNHKCSEPLSSAAFLPGGQHIALGAMTGEVFIYDLRTLRVPLATLAAHDKAVSSILLQPAGKLVSDGSSSDVKSTTAKPKNKSGTASVVPSKPPPETPIPTESFPSSTSQPSCLTGAEPSQEPMAAFFSPVRPTEQLEINNTELSEQKTGNQFILDDVLSPVRFDGFETNDSLLLSSSQKKMTNMCDEMFSPIRDSAPIGDGPINFQALLSPLNIPSRESGSLDGSCADPKSDTELPADPVQITKTSKTSTSAKDYLSPRLSQKENTDPNSGSPISNVNRKDFVATAEKREPKHILSPARHIEVPKRNIVSPNMNNRKCEIEVPEFHITVPSQIDTPVFVREEMKEVFSLKTLNESGQSTLEGDNTSMSEDHNSQPQNLPESQGNNAASHLQIELIRNCMADVLEDFQDDVNKRMMHLQYIVTKQYLQLKETVENLQQQQALNADLLLEVEQLRSENAQLKAHF